MTVTCICPTMASRREWLPKAIACFLAQTYEDRRMLIVADEAGDIEGLIPADEARISIIVIGKKLTIGEKRNLAAAKAESELIAHFDDDDFSAPARLADQVTRLESTGKAVTGYHSVVFSDGSRRWQYHGSPNWAFDSTLCYRKDFWKAHPFDAINDGLEMRFRSAAINAGQFVSVAAGDHMVISIHDNNTGPRVMSAGSTSWEELTAESAS